MVTWTQVDGVPIAWGSAPGPLKASLMFRVGKADETLPTNGITHLVEHLTLFPLGQVPHYQNGSVRTTFTSFDTAGEPEEVVGFLLGVCNGLRHLTTERLAAEVRVVETEAARRPNSTHTALLTWRYGAVGPGLWGFDEYATRTVTPESLQQWSDQMFTRENAVLVLTGPPPPGLSLPLASGVRVESPALVTVPPVLPAWLRHAFQDVAASTVLPRSVGALAYTYVFQHRLTDRLRYELGLAYSPSVAYDPYDGATAQVIATADAHPDHVSRVATVFSEVVTELAENGPDPAVLEEYKALAIKFRTDPHYASSSAAYEATQLLLSGTQRSMEAVNLETDSLTSAQVHEAAVAARGAMLLGLPMDIDVPPGWTEEAPPWSIVAPVQGTRLTRELTVEEQPGELVLGDEGLTRDFGDGRVVTARYSDTAAVLVRPDGQRILIASDAMSITVEPRLWREGFDAVAQIDAATAHLAVPMPARDPDDIPSASRAQPTGGGRPRPQLDPNAPRVAPPAPADGRLNSRVLIGLLVLLIGIVIAIVGVASGHLAPGSFTFLAIGAVVAIRNGRGGKSSKLR